MASNRLLIGQGLVALLAGIINPTTNQPIYGTAKLGAILDPTPYSSFVEVVDPRGKLGHAGSGGTVIGWRVQDEVMFKITSGWDYEQDSEQAMINMLTAQDIVLPTFASHVMVPDPNNPSQPVASVYELLEDNGQTDQAVPIRFPNGRVYICWSFWAIIKQQYNVLLSIP